MPTQHAVKNDKGKIIAWLYVLVASNGRKRWYCGHCGGSSKGSHLPYSTIEEIEDLARDHWKRQHARKGRR